jgi:AcrR family transcriptional regulator
MLPSMTPPSVLGRHVTADDWIRAGFAVLADGGPDALRIGRLCQELNVTKGSFYWHFADIQAYRTALAGAWGSLHDERRLRFDDIREADPGKRLAMMMQTLVRPDHWALDRAMRIWALTDETVLASVRRSDERVMRAVRQTFVDCGFEEDEAELRAAILFAAGVGLLYGTAGSIHDGITRLREHVVDFMLRR